VSNPFIAEIRIFPFGFAPRGWASCNGQLLPISQNTALFSLLGVTFGGDGRSTFRLPNLQGNAPLAPGQGTGLSLRDLGDTGGETAVTLMQSQTPSHAHSLQGDARPATLNSPGPQNALARSAPGKIYKTPSGAATPQPLAANVLSSSGGGMPHNNLQPYLTLNFCIALQGVYPARS
jgi:microcystin-dependent protein